MKENNKENTLGVFHYLAYKRIKESNTDLSFFDFIQKLEKLQKKIHD
ncbi:Putative Hac prophage II protein [Helicobacter pylori B38]|nr:Putative Hac prophage II protein [Helicobacter pylori B38]